MAHEAGDHGGTMKALVQEGYGSADVLHVRDIPRPALMEGCVLVRMRAASVNALDWHTTHGGLLLEIIAKVMRQQDEPVRGVDLAGTVDAVGPHVTRFKAGDDVFGGAPASFAEYVLAREDRLLLKPRDLSFEEAAAINVAGRTALQGLRDHAQLKPGQRVLIHGAGGGVGTFAGPDREGAWRARHRGDGSAERRPHQVARRRRGHRLHEGGLRASPRALRRGPRHLRDALGVGPAARLGTERHVRAGGRGEERRLDRGLRADHQCDGAWTR
jgi:hypothetical protein